MWRRSIRYFRSLSAQMIISLMVLVLLTAVAAGLPALWLLRQQLERHAWAQLQQGSRAAQALYAARQDEVNELATLTAQRPTLKALLASGPAAELPAYLQVLQGSTGLDLILLCDMNGYPVAQTGTAPPDDLCGDVHLRSPWVLAAVPVDAPDGSRLGTVMAGIRLDDQFAAQMQSQTGLEHTLLVDGQPIATSLSGRRPSGSQPDQPLGTFRVAGHPYYYSRFPVGEAGLEVELALPVTDIVATQRHLAWAYVGGIGAVAVVASLLGVLLAQRISRPLARLAEAATRLSNGDLSPPTAVGTNIREVALVAQALEGARVDLQQTLVELRHEKAWADHLLEAIVEGIMTLDRHGMITFFSPGAERITGWQRQQVIGCICDHIFPLAESDQPFSQLIPLPGQRRKIAVRLPDGRQAVLAFTGARLTPSGSSDARVALVFRDVSEEEAVRRLLAHFLANVSHEFRTPLSALAASVELLLDQAPDLSPAELGELLTTLHLGVLGLQTLVDNLLETASIEAGRFRVSPRRSNLSDIIAEAIRMMQPLLGKHDQRLLVEVPATMPTVQADPRRTVQVLVNLLSNASKYGPDDSQITIGVTVDPRWARVMVTDQGEGIPPEQQHDLFRRFIHVSHANDGAQVGVGLGLSVVKAIVEGHGGQVGVDGPAFWFTLPLETPKKPASEMPTPAEGTS